MFARAGISGRILRSGRDGTAPVSLHPFLARPKKKVKTKWYCYVPVVWQAVVAVVAGFMGLLAGTAMCTFGYYAIPLPTPAPHNETSGGEEEGVPNLSGKEYGHLHNLAYVGPVLMGIGCFVIVVSCVHVCELRDLKIKEFEDRRIAEEAKRGGNKKAKQRMYNKIVKQLRARLDITKTDKVDTTTDKEEPAEASASGSAKEKALQAKNSHREMLKGLLRRCSAMSIMSTRSDYSNISLALKNIPSEIFTVDIDGKNNTSLHPIRIISRKRRASLALTTKFSSDPCLSKRKQHTLVSRRSIGQSDKSQRHANAPKKPMDLLTDHPPPSHAADGDHHATVRAVSDPISTSNDRSSNVIVHHASVHYECERQAARSAWNHESVCASPNATTETCFAGTTDQDVHVVHCKTKTDNAKQTEQTSAHHQWATILNGCTQPAHKSSRCRPPVSLPRVDISGRGPATLDSSNRQIYTSVDSPVGMHKHAATSTPHLYTEDMQQFHYD